ncbi:MAG: ribosome biogenesis factor YjgA [Pseudoxanthomonas sp.]
MRGRDPETGEFYGPSRSQQRREALGVRELAERLVALPPARLAKLPMPEDLLAHVRDTQKVSSHIAHKRQLQYLAKQMRKQDDAALEAIRDALDEGGDAARAEAALLHQAEAWRERLLAEGDAALSALLDAFPAADRQRLRTLARNAADERARDKPRRAFRELFREVKGLLKGEASDDTADDVEASDEADEDTLG